MNTKLFSLLFLLVGIAQSQNLGWTTFTPSISLEQGSFSAIAIDSVGNKWIGIKGSSTRSLFKFDGVNWSYIDTSHIWGACSFNLHRQK